jgi:glutamine amidotransferase
MVTLVDYGIGNIQAFANIFRHLHHDVSIARTETELASATRLVLPGVGAFDWAMERLDASGMRPTLDDLVVKRGVPVLGVCVGMQMMARRSDEGVRPGLGWIDADVRRFDDARSTARTWLPHMGWNDVRPVADSAIFRGIELPRFYFLHSYYVAPADASLVSATTDYAGVFASAVSAGNVHGVQFHPEKSHGWGIQLLSNFSAL